MASAPVGDYLVSVTGEQVAFGPQPFGLVAQGAMSTPSFYVYPWYDGTDAGVPGLAGGHDPLVNRKSAPAVVSVGAALQGSYMIPAGGQVTQLYGAVSGGPLVVESVSGMPLVISQRIFWNGSFESDAPWPELPSPASMCFRGTTRARPA